MKPTLVLLLACLLPIAPLSAQTTAATPPAPPPPAGESKSPKLVVGDIAPPLSGLIWQRGEPFSTFDPNKVYVVSCWSIWARPSLAAIPVLNEAAENFKSSGLVILNVEVTAKTPAPADNKYLQSMNFSAAADGPEQSFANTWILPYDSIPYNFIIAGGKIAWTGSAFEPDFRQKLQELTSSAEARSAATPLPTAENVAPAATAAPVVSSDTAKIPDAQIRRLTDLISAGKIEEAAKVAEALVNFFPDDPRAAKYKSQIAALGATTSAAPSTPPSPGPPSASTPAAAAQPTGRDRIVYNSTLLLLQQARESDNSNTRTSLLRRFLYESAPLADKYPTLLHLWQARAAVALELDEARPGILAGDNLLKLGAADSSDPALQNLLAQLHRKTWLDQDKADAIRARDKEEADRAEAERQARLAEQKAAAEKAEADRKAAEEKARFDASPEGRIAKLRQILQGPVDPTRLAELRQSAKELKTLAPNDNLPDEFLAATDLERLAAAARSRAVALRNPPDDEAAKLGYVCILPARSGDVKAAKTALQTLRYGPKIDSVNNSYFLRVIAEYQFAQNSIAEAITTLESIEDAPNRWTGSLYLGRQAGRRGYKIQAEYIFSIAYKALEQILKDSSEARDPLNRTGQLAAVGEALAGAGIEFDAEARKIYDQAEQLVAKVNARADNGIQLTTAWGQIGISYSRAGWVDQAINALENMSSQKVKILVPGAVYSCWNGAMEARLRLGDVSGANRILTNARTAMNNSRSRFKNLDPEEFTTLPSLALAPWLAKQGRFKEARETFLNNGGKVRYHSDDFLAVLDACLNAGAVDDAKDFLDKAPLGFGTEDDVKETVNTIAYAKGSIAAALLRNKGLKAYQDYTSSTTDDLFKYQAALKTAQILTPIPVLE